MRSPASLRLATGHHWTVPAISAAPVGDRLTAPVPPRLAAGRTRRAQCQSRWLTERRRPPPSRGFGKVELDARFAAVFTADTHRRPAPASAMIPTTTRFPGNVDAGDNGQLQHRPSAIRNTMNRGSRQSAQSSTDHRRLSAGDNESISLKDR